MPISPFSAAFTPDKNFVIYRSSAGSGKTYTLTREYLSLALKSPQYFRAILAVTFTNKASQEMKTRIIESLHQLAGGSSDGLAIELRTATGFNEKQLQKQAQEVLSAILHDYSFFAVSTIDSFFQTVIRAFAREVGLRAGFKVELEQEKVLEELIDLLLKEVQTDKVLREWLIQYTTDRVDEGYSWDIRQDIRRLAGEIFTEDFKRHEKALQEVAREPGRFLHFLHLLKELRDGFEEQMEQIGRQALQLMENHGLQLEDFSYGKTGVAAYFLRIQKDKKDYEPKTRATEALDNPEKWYSKSAKNKEDIETAVAAGLNELLRQAMRLYAEEHARYITAQQILRFVYTFGLLAKLTEKLRQYREEHELMLISDAAVFLRDIIGENEAPFIYEKTGSHFQHFLIDEFQDTSGFQWENFRPLVANSVASGNYNLVVGDSKQSIYRWRGGDWQLLLNQIELDIGAHQTATVELLHNWRSCREIIAFNNQLFLKAASALKQVYLDQVASVPDEAEQGILAFDARHITNAYKDVLQHFPDIKAANARCGYVQLQFLENKAAEEPEEEMEEEAAGDWKARARENLLRSVEQLQDKGYRLKDIALLVRTKGDGKELADALMQAAESKPKNGPYRYQVVSNESLFLDSAASVCLLLNILRYMNNGNDLVARANMVYDYQTYILGRREQNLHSLFRSASRYEDSFEQYLPPSFVEKRPYLNKLPLYELVENLILEFELHKITGEWAYLQAFQDAVLNFAKTERGDIVSFLEWWKGSGSKLSVQLSNALDAIRIHTIHTAKGLQFKAVIVPYCNWRLDHNTRFNNFIWSKTEQQPFNKMEVLPIRYTGKLKESIFRLDYYREQLKAYLDNLNLLYVAFTRAEEALFAFAPLPAIDKKTGQAKATEISGLLYRLFESPEPADLSAHWNSDTATFSMGRLQQTKHGKEVSETKQLELRHYFTHRWRNRLAIRKRSGSLAYTKAGEEPADINWSQTIHTILARTATRAELPTVLDEVYFEGLINREEQKLVGRKIEQLFRHPQAGKWFDEGWEVRTAFPILTASGNISRPDRVITKEKTAIVINFKTIKPQAEHANSIRYFMSLLKRMHYQEVKGYLFYLEDEEVEEVF